MRYLIESIERAIAKNQFLPGVITALTVPDVAVAAMNIDNHTSGPRYAAWSDRWFHQELPYYREIFSLDGTTLYAIRCTLLSQGMATPARSAARPRGNKAIVKRQLCFTSEEGGARSLELAGVPTVCLGAREFSLAMAAAGRAWLAQVSNDVAERLRMLREVRSASDLIEPDTVILCVDY